MGAAGAAVVTAVGTVVMAAAPRVSPPAVPARVMAMAVPATTDTVWAVAVGSWRRESARSAWPDGLAGMAIDIVPPLALGVASASGVREVAQGSYQVAW